jgi:autotransporter-associated beta strand protein
LPQLKSLQFVSKGLNNFLVAGGYGTLYAARDTDLENWYSLKGNLPNTFVWEMDYSSRDDILAVGTLGRGAFTLAEASTLMPATTPTSVDTGWIRLLGASSGDQTLNGGTVQNPESVTLGMNLSLTSLGGIFDTTGPDPALGTNSTLTGVISGPGSFTITGNGILALRGMNTYSGGTNLNGGIVNVERDANLGSGNLTFNGGSLQIGTLQTAANFTFTRAITLNPYGGILDIINSNTSSSALTVTGIISGTGTLTKNGDGLLALTPQGGPNTYSGGTLLNGGTLRVTNNASLGAAGSPLTFNGGTLRAAGPLTSSRTLVVLGSGTFDTGTFASVFSGELFGYGMGTFTQTGTGSLTLNGDGSPFAGTYALNSGALTLNNVLGSTLAPCGLVVNPGSTFSGGGNLLGSLNLQGDGSGFAGSVLVPSSSTLRGDGPLAGSLDLEGDGSNYGGAYTVTNGTFNLNNTLGGSPTPCTVVVNPDSFMTGNGPLVGSLLNKGSISPGNSPGTLSVVGSYTQTPGSTYIAEIASASSYDRIAVTGTPGTATLAGTLSPVLLSGYRPPGNTVFPGVVTASGGITGSFNPLSNPFFAPTLYWQPRYSANSVDLLVQRDYINQGLNLNSNQLAVGSILNSVANTATWDLNQVLNTIDFLPNAGAVRQAYQQISPEKVVPLPEMGFTAAVLQQRSLAQRITDLRFGTGNLTLSSGLPGFLNLFGSRRAGGIMLAYNGANLAGMVPAIQEAAPGKEWGVFLDPAVIIGNQGSSANQTGYDYTLAGFTLGVDYRLRPDLLVGLATGYSHNSAGFRGTGGNLTNNTWPITAYAAYLPEKGYAFASLGYSLNLFDLEREISFPGVNRTAKSSTTGHQFNLYAEAGYDLKPKNLKPLVVTPAASLAFSTISVNGFTETNAGALNLDVDAQNADSVQLGVGAKVAAPFQKGSAKVVPQAYAFYQHECSKNSRGLDARLSQGSSTLTFTTDEPQRNFALVGGNVTVFVSKNLSARVDYNAEVGRGNSTVHQVNAGLRWNF